MSERTVPRRESPWGLPEDARQPKAHRCNDRVEDVVQEHIRRLQSIHITDFGILLKDEVILPLCPLRGKGKACFEGNPFKTIPGPFKLFWRCMHSKPGEEPTEPFYYLQLEPPKREVHLE